MKKERSPNSYPVEVEVELRGQHTECTKNNKCNLHWKIGFYQKITVIAN